MNLTKVILIYFSPTGTTQKALKAFAAGFDLPMEDIDLTNLKVRQKFHRSFQPDELVVVGLPVYGGLLPKNLDDFFDAIEGNNTPAVATVTYGNRAYDDALLELKTRMEERGFIVNAAATFIGQHTYSNKIVTGRPDADDLAVIRDFGRQTEAMLSADNNRRLLQLKGTYPFTAKGFSTTLRPVTTDDCNRCGLCAENCPWGAIDFEDYSNQLDNPCLLCLRCVQICPVGARQIKDEKFLNWLPQFEARLNAKRCEPEIFLPQ